MMGCCGSRERFMQAVEAGLDAGLTILTDRSTWHLILEDVLKKYRNGGAHESAISYATCEDCIRDLIGSNDRLGLVTVKASTHAQIP
jgi:hypothetical protein